MDQSTIAIHEMEQDHRLFQFASPVSDISASSAPLVESAEPDYRAQKYTLETVLASESYSDKREAESELLSSMLSALDGRDSNKLAQEEYEIIMALLANQSPQAIKSPRSVQSTAKYSMTPLPYFSNTQTAQLRKIALLCVFSLACSLASLAPQVIWLGSATVGQSLWWQCTETKCTQLASAHIPGHEMNNCAIAAMIIHSVLVLIGFFTTGRTSAFMLCGLALICSVFGFILYLVYSMNLSAEYSVGVYLAAATIPFCFCACLIAHKMPVHGGYRLSAK